MSACIGSWERPGTEWLRGFSGWHACCFESSDITTPNRMERNNVGKNELETETGREHPPGDGRRGGQDRLCPEEPVCLHHLGPRAGGLPGGSAADRARRLGRHGPHLRVVSPHPIYQSTQHHRSEEHTSELQSP